MDSALRMLTEGRNLGSGPPPQIKAANSEGREPDLSYQKGWKRSITVLASEDGPLKWTGKVITRTSALEASARICRMSSSNAQGPSRQAPHPVQWPMSMDKGNNDFESNPAERNHSSACLAMDDDTPDSSELPQTTNALMNVAMSCSFIITERIPPPHEAR